MTNEKELKQFVESYTDANGSNPISAAFSLWTVAKTVPFQLIKAGLVGVFFIMVSFVLTWWLGLPWLYFLILQILSGIGFFFITFFAAFKFLSSFVINAIADLLSGVLSPIDDMYEVYKDSSAGNIGRVQFSKRVIREVVFPRVSDILQFIPMKKRISQVLSIFADRVADSNDNISYDQIKDSSVKSMIAKINQAANTTKRITGKPFAASMIYYMVLWMVAVVIYFWINYEFGF